MYGGRQTLELVVPHMQFLQLLKVSNARGEADQPEGDGQTQKMTSKHSSHMHSTILGLTDLEATSFTGKHKIVRSHRSSFVAEGT